MGLANHILQVILAISLFFTIHIHSLKAQSNVAKPEKVYRLVYVQKSNDWYKQQAKLWKNEIDKNPKNAEAWYNYYLATEYSYFDHPRESEKEINAKLNKIIKDMARDIPGTYEYYYLAYRYDETNISNLEKAFQLRPDYPETYYGLIVYYEMNGDNEKVQQFYEKLYQSKDIVSGLVNYNHNVLMSTEKNAILFTNGDNDTFPAEMLQRIKGIRKDVTVLNVHLIQKNKSYLERLLKQKNITIDLKNIATENRAQFIAKLCKNLAENYPDIPIYFALTVNKSYREPLQDDLYIVGLAFQYNPQNKLDNLALLKKNLEKNFRLDYLTYDWYSETHIVTKSIVRKLNTNYVTPFVMLYEHYKTSGEKEHAKYWKDFALDIARKAGNKVFIDYIQKR